jgi:uncharacterized membrane protein
MENTMKYATFRIWKWVVILILYALVAWATFQGNAWVPLPASVAAVFILFIARRSVKETIVDERTYSIANHASRIAFQLGIIIVILVGATLVALGQGDYPDLADPGFALLFSAGGMTVLYIIAYYIIAARMGGKE